MKRFWRSFFSILGFVSLFLAAVHLTQVKTARGMALRLVKSFSEALSPFLTAAAAVSAIACAALHSPWASAASAAAAAVQACYVWLVTRPHRSFEEGLNTEHMERGKDGTGSGLHRWEPHPVRPARWRWPGPNSRGEPRWERDLVYHTIRDGIIEDENGRPDQELRCDLWQPPRGVPASGLALIYVHGGGFFSSSKDFGTRGFIRHMAGQGHVIMDIDYRLAPLANIFDMVDDVHAAILWMKNNAEWLGAGHDKLVLIGGSAGALLALLAAYTANHPRLTKLDLQGANLSVSGVVSYYGLVDVAATYKAIQKFMASAPTSRTLPENILDRPLAGNFIRLAAWVRGVDPPAMRQYLRENQALMAAGVENSMAKLLGGSPEEVPDMYALISPINHAGPGCPPTLIFQGQHDYLLPLGPTRALYQKLRAAGVPVVYVELPWTEHTFDLFLPQVSPPALSALHDLERFLRLLQEQKLGF